MSQHPAFKAFAGRFYTWLNTQRQQPTAGFEVMAFSSLMLPLQDWKGPGEIVQRQLYLTAPAVYQAHVVVPTGIAGITAGQAISVGLMDAPG